VYFYLLVCINYNQTINTAMTWLMVDKAFLNARQSRMDACRQSHRQQIKAIRKLRFKAAARDRTGQQRGSMDVR